MACQKSLSAIACSVEFLNTGDEDYYLLKRNTPLEGLLSPFIDVYYKEISLEYKGIYIHRNPPTKDEFVLLKSRETISAIVKVNDAFSFDKNGLYRIEYVEPLMVATKEGMIPEYVIMEEVNVNMFTLIELEDASQVTHPIQEEEEEEEEEEEYNDDFDDDDSDDDTVDIESCSTANFKGGTQQQRSDILEAHKKLCSQFKVAQGKVGNNNMYKTWFGKYKRSRARKVKRVCRKCARKLKRKSVRYTINPSGCQSNWNAYVTSSRRRNVNLCPAFHSYAVFCVSSGAPTKEGILAHEWTHNFGRTRDYSYGATANKNLAKNKPRKAVRNADTYEFWYCLSQF